METPQTFNHTSRIGNSLYVRLSFPLLEYLSSDYTLARSNRYSKIQAFKSLVQHCCNSPETSCEGKAMVKFSKLASEWIWNRTTVRKFIGVLYDMGVVQVQKVGTEKYVSVNSSILQWQDCSQNEAERLRGDFLQPQTPSSQSSSSERNKSLSSGEMSLDK